MKRDDMERFTTAISKLCMNFSRPTDALLFEVYREALDDKRIEDIEAAVREVNRKSQQYMPNAGQLRKITLAVSAKRNGVAFIEGTGWVSLTGNPERAEHPDTLDKRADALLGPSGQGEAKRLVAVGSGPPRATSGNDVGDYVRNLANTKHWTETGGDDDAA